MDHYPNVLNKQRETNALRIKRVQYYLDLGKTRAEICELLGINMCDLYNWATSYNRITGESINLMQNENTRREIREDSECLKNTLADLKKTAMFLDGNRKFRG